MTTNFFPLLSETIRTSLFFFFDESPPSQLNMARFSFFTARVGSSKETKIMQPNNEA